MTKRLSVSLIGAFVLSFFAFWSLMLLILNTDFVDSKVTSNPINYSLFEFDLSSQKTIQNTIYYKDQENPPQGKKIYIRDGCGKFITTGCFFPYGYYDAFDPKVFGLCLNLDCEVQPPKLLQQMAFYDCAAQYNDKRKCLSFVDIPFSWKLEKMPKIFRDLPYPS